MKRILFYGYIVSYISAIVPPIFLDPILTTHVRYGSRDYPFAPYTILILAFLMIAEYFVLKRAERSRQMYWWWRSLVPYSIAFVLTLLIFLPEKPHGNVAFVCLSILMISAITIYIRWVSETLMLDDCKLQPGNLKQMEYLKEALSASKQLLFGLLAGYAGTIIALYSRMLTFSEDFVKNPDEAWLLSLNASYQFGMITFYFLLGPITFGFQNIRRLLDQMKRIAQTTDTSGKE